jgi:hypothetical protein
MKKFGPVYVRNSAAEREADKSDGEGEGMDM